MNDEDEQKGYSWEAGYADGLNIGEVLVEDEGGSIEKSIAKYVAESKKKLRQSQKPAKVRLGIMRHVMIVIDCSKFMISKDMPPSRFTVVMKTINLFLDRFFEQNPIAQIGFITCKDKKAERLSILTGNVRHLKESLANINEAFCSGDFSLQNCLQLASANLRSLPGHVSREVIVLMASLSSIDPANIFETIEQLKSYNIRCSVIGLAAELFVCKVLARETRGTYTVALHEGHLQTILGLQTNPPVNSKATECSAVRVGFPPHKIIKTKSFCVCHPDGEPLNERGFICEQCGARHCSIPSECPICKLTLAAAPQLARAFRHIVPLDMFKPKKVVGTSCSACEQRIDDEGYECPKCVNIFCFDCDTLLHESLHVCPMCWLNE